MPKQFRLGTVAATIFAYLVLGAGPGTAQFAAPPGPVYCISAWTVPNFQSYQLVYNELKSICSEPANVFYCFPRLSLNESEICRNGGMLVQVPSYGAVQIGLAPEDTAFSNKPFIFACSVTTRPYYDGASWYCV